MTFAFIQNVPSQTAKLFPTTLQVSLEPSTGGFRHAPSLYRTAMFFPYAPLTHDCPALVWPSAQLLARPSFAAFCAAEAGGELRHKFCAVQLCTVRSCELCLIPSTTYHLRTEIEGEGAVTIYQPLKYYLRYTDLTRLCIRELARAPLPEAQRVPRALRFAIIEVQ